MLLRALFVFATLTGYQAANACNNGGQYNPDISCGQLAYNCGDNTMGGDGGQANISWYGTYGKVICYDEVGNCTMMYCTSMY